MNLTQISEIDWAGIRASRKYYPSPTHWEDESFYFLMVDRKDEAALRRGRQYLREISGDGVNFGLPCMLGGQIRSLVPWSRLFDDQEVLLAINTDPAFEHSAWATIDDSLHQAGTALTCIYSSSAAQLHGKVNIANKNGKAVYLTVPAGGLVIYK
jgi:hypothetical protein